MNTYQAISLMAEFGMLLISLISLIVVIVKAITGAKNNHPAPQDDYFNIVIFMW